MVRQIARLVGSSVLLFGMLCVGVEAHAEAQEAKGARGPVAASTIEIEQVEALRHALRDGDALAHNNADELILVVLDANNPARVRRAALRLLCDRSPEEKAEAVIAGIATLASRTPKGRRQPDPEFYTTPMLLGDFLRDDAGNLSSRLRNPSRLLDLYLEILSNEALNYPRVRRACFERIADNPARLAIRQDYVVRVIQLRPGDPAPEAFHGLVDDEFAERLRPLLFREPVNEAGYNIGVLALLTEYGDQESAKRFRKWASDHGYTEEVIGRVGGPVWKIEAQKEPSKLLDHLRSNEWISHQTRLWTLERLVRLGVERAKIRAALLEHAGSVGEDERLLLDLGNLKAMAKEQGILEAGDLPSVPSQPQGR